ncbi:MAG: efflux RND transporter permease subunit [Bdellovibrionota bacterium]|nr:efflux RND transporter permease subunit [Bdellovibrionota bacterium]
MRKLIEFFLERSLLVNLLTVMILLVGGISLYGLQKETFPSVEFDIILVTTGYPGSSSEDVEKLVTIPLEREIKSVDGVNELNALSAEGSSIIYMEVDADANLDDVLEDTKNAIDTVDDLPDDATVPIVTSLDNKQRGILSVTLTGQDYDLLRVTSKRLRDQLERVSGIAQVELDGYRIDEVRIELDPQKMAEYEVTVSEIYRAVQERNLNLSGGNIKSPEGDIIVRTLAEFESTEDIENVIIVSNNSGRKVELKKVAAVKRGPREEGILQRSNGEVAIFLNVKARESADILDTTNSLKSVTEDFFKENKELGIGYKYTDDLSYYVKRRLSILKDNGIMGMILVFVTLLLFLNARTSFITSMGAPIAFMVAFLIMDMMGLSVNLISMFALILVLGMLVDDSIIVAEYYYQQLEAGLPPHEAARKAAWNTIKPVTATIATTMVAFGSLFFMGGIMGKFLWPVPAVVIICLLASLLECFFILPSHLADFCRLSKKEQGRRWYDSLTDFYAGILKFFIKKPWIILGSFFFIFVGSVFMATKMDFELFPGDDVRTVFFQVKGKVGAPLEETDKAVMKLEEMVLQELNPKELDQIKAQVGVLRGDNGNKTGNHYGSIVLYLTPPGDRERSTDEILNTLTEKGKNLVPEYTITTTKIQGGPPKGKAVDIQLTSDSLDELKASSKVIHSLLSEEKGILAPEIDFEEGKEQVVLDVNDAEARRLGLSTQQIAVEIRRILSGDSVTEIRESDEDIEIKLFFSKAARSSVDSLMLLNILNSQGRRIPLRRVVTLKKQPGAFVIRRLNRKRIISVTSDIDKKVTTPIKVAADFAPKVKKALKDFPSVDFKFGGENEDTQESMFRLLKSGVLALGAIFIILVIMFNSLLHPVVVMSAIPLGLIGVIWTFKITGHALGFMALMGVVALIGVVVNDSIVLVTFINEKLEELGEENLGQAVFEASKGRFRAVILTTVTTVAGLVPIAHPSVSKVLSFGANTDSDPFLQPMALSFAWGLFFASLVTLFFVPCNYLVFERSKKKIKGLLSRLKRDKESAALSA